MAELGDLLVSVGVAPRVEVTTEMMDYAFVDKCEDKDTLRAILAALKSGKEGHFPHLIQHTEQKLLSVLPEAERKKIQRLKANPTPTDISEAEAELSSWSSEIAEADKRLSAQTETKGVAANSEAIFDEARQAVQHPVRGRGAAATTGSSSGNSNSNSSTSSSAQSNSNTTKRISGYDFRAWEKFDVDKAVQEVDEEEEHSAKAREDAQQRHRLEAEKRRQRYMAEVEEVRASLHVDSMSELQRQKMAVREKEKGNECFKAAEHEQAHWFYTRSIALDSTNAAVFANRAIAAIRLERFEAAEHDCTMALELSPTYTKAYLRRGMARYRRGRYGPSLQDFQRALELEPGNKEILSLMAKARQKFAEVEGIEYDDAEADAGEGAGQPIERTFQASDGQQTRRIIADAGEPEPLSGWTRSIVSKGAQAGLPYGTRATAAEIAEPSKSGFTKIAIAEDDDDDDEDENDEGHYEAKPVQADASPGADNNSDDTMTSASAAAAPAATDVKRFSRIEITEEDDSGDENDGSNNEIDKDGKNPSKNTASAPDQVETLKLEGNNAMAAKDHTLAVQKYSEALEIDPSNVAVRNNRALAYLLMNDFAKCEADCTHVLQRDPSNVKALLRRAMALERLGSVEAAVKDLDCILAVRPDHAEALKEKKRMQAAASASARPEPAAEEAERNQPSVESTEWEVAQLRQKAAKLAAAGNHAKAIDTWKRCLELTPADSDDRITLYRQLSTCYLAVGRPKDAMQQLELLLQLDPQNLKAKFQYARLLVEQGRYDEARAALRDILGVSPTDADAMALLDELSTRQLGEEIKLDPAASDSFKQQGNTLLTQGDVPGAIEMYSKSLAANPQNLASRNNRAMAYLRTGKYAEAEADCNVVLTAEPANVKALFRRASARKEMGNFSTALADLEKVETVEPGNAQCAKLKKEVMDLIRQAGDRALTEQQQQQASNKQPATTSAPSSQPRPADVSKQPDRPARSGQPKVDANARVTERKLEKAGAGGLDLREVRSTRRSNAAQTASTPQQQDAGVPAGVKNAGAENVERDRAAAAATQAKPVSPTRSPAKPRDLAVPSEPPTTLYELERVWRTLKGRPDLFARYLRTFKTSTLKKVLKQAAMPELLSDILQTTNEFLAAQHPKSAVRVLQGLARCPSFNMMVALMFDADKLAVKSTFERLRGAGTDTATLEELEREYAL